jgi:hypothetical protein
MRRNDRQDLQPTMPGAEGREIVAHIGSQTIRVPALLLIEHGRRSLEDLERWKSRASARERAIYTALQGALNLLIPILREILKSGEAVTGIPPLPKRERHTDPVTYLLGYCHAFLPHVLSKGEFTLDVDEDGRMRSLDWSYLEQLRAVAEAQRHLQSPVVDASEPDILEQEGEA